MIWLRFAPTNAQMQSAPGGTMSGPGVALTTPALPTTWMRGSEMAKRTCSAEGCDRPHYGRGWCNLHYRRWVSHGTTDLVVVSAEEKFWRRVRKGEGCWVWIGVRLVNGYGAFQVGPRKRSYAHRVSWELHNGPIPNGLFVCHHCDNPPCVRPDHLFLGTHLDNMRDAAQKGRLQRNGMPRKRPGPSKKRRLTDEQAEYIRGALALGARQVDLAVRFGVKPNVVQKIKRGLTYVPMPETSA